MTKLTIEEKLAKAKAAVAAARDEALLAVEFHETWRPTVNDPGLRRRMGNSYATHSFHIIRMALRREVLLGLMRLWDDDSRGVKVTFLAEVLREKAVFNLLVSERAQRIGLAGNATAMVDQDLGTKRDEIQRLVRKYSGGGTRVTLLERLKTLRHEKLAHRQVDEPADSEALHHTEDEVEEFYQDTLEIVRLLLSVFLAQAFDIANDGGHVYRTYADYFWAAARGEKTEGHPRYRAPMTE